jgi:hypothetical protein
VLCVTISVEVAVCVTAPLVPLRVSGYEPGGVEAPAETVIVEEPGPVIEGGAKEAVAPVGNPLTLSFVAPLKPLIALTVVV